MPLRKSSSTSNNGSKAMPYPLRAATRTALTSLARNPPDTWNCWDPSDMTKVQTSEPGPTSCTMQVWLARSAGVAGGGGGPQEDGGGPKTKKTGPQPAPHQGSIRALPHAHREVKPVFDHVAETIVGHEFDLQPWMIGE